MQQDDQNMEEDGESDNSDNYAESFGVDWQTVMLGSMQINPEQIQRNENDSEDELVETSFPVLSNCRYRVPRDIKIEFTYLRSCPGSR